MSVVWDEDNADIPLGREVRLDFRYGDSMRLRDAGTQRILYRVIPRDPSLPNLTQRLSALVDADDPRGPDPNNPTNPCLLYTSPSPRDS